MTAVCANEKITEEELDEVLTLLGAFGKTEVVSEHLIDVVVSVCGSFEKYVTFMSEEQRKKGGFSNV